MFKLLTHILWRLCCGCVIVSVYVDIVQYLSCSGDLAVKHYCTISWYYTSQCRRKLDYGRILWVYFDIVQQFFMGIYVVIFKFLKFYLNPTNAAYANIILKINFPKIQKMKLTTKSHVKHIKFGINSIIYFYIIYFYNKISIIFKSYPIQYCC